MTTTLEFAVTGMHCNSCGLLIDDEVKELPGVKTGTTSLRSVVECEGQLDPAAVVAAIGYTAVPGG